MQDKILSNRELSATSLAKELGMTSQELFQRLVESELIIRSGDTWELTSLGKSQGGVYKHSDKFGRYVVWPESIVAELEDNHDASHELLTATAIGKNFQMSPNRINSILSELGWIKKDAIKGWHITELGKRLGGAESKYATSGVSFVRWPESIIKNEILVTNIRQASGDVSQTKKEESHNIIEPDPTEYREKFKAEYRAKDGHYVRSKAELIIDNALYDYKIVHAYERKLQVEEGLYCDFYIPTRNVYIEYWGLEDEKYLARKEKKIEIYRKYKFNLIELLDKDVSNLDDTLPAKLLDFGIPIE